MRAAGLPLVAALLAGGCDQPAERTTPAAPPSPIAAPAVPQAPAGERLTAKVSGLTGDVGGFERRETDTRVILALATDTLFAFDRAELGPNAAANLLKVADGIRAGGAGDVTITGFTDAKGEPPYNQALSQRRAQAVADWMAEQPGVRLRRFVVVGRGEAEPVAPNTRPDGGDDPDGRARNRRVEVSIPK